MHVPSLLDVLVIVFLFLLLFGGSRLSGLGRGIGEGIKNFKKGLHNDEAASSGAPPAPPSDPQSGR
jgi:sec-independent protein translocase protein TatA